MAFDQPTRNLLSSFVSEARSLLSEEFTRQLKQDYGLDPDRGEVTALDKLIHLNDARLETARILRDTLAHYEAGLPSQGAKGRIEALQRIVREQAFTVLNRLCALRMAEARGLLIESIAKGYQSDGFQLYTRLAGSSLGETGDAYRNYLFSLFDEFAVDLAVLFDRFSPQGRLFPRESVLAQLLDEINHVEMESLWAEDETIGWIYQYFNSSEERRQMRAESSAPRNSRELAVRNQFFTPRYVVEFLTDNTLGRIWYEMRKGDTTLKNDCSYLVRRPTEVFLAPGEKAPAEKENEIDLSQEEMLKKAVYNEHRPKKDPRDLRVLDPACGSGHFLLYAFDLLDRIYEESWDDPKNPKSETTGRTLREEYETLGDLHQAIPKLIIEHNLHGIDIDPRAVQIAGLALWLRAQKTWKNIGIMAAKRPQIAKSNIVTAEPMPGDDGMRKEFAAGLKPRVLGQLVDVVFEKMKLAGEVGSLLKIEEEIEDAVAEAKKQWLEEPKPEQLLLFPGMTDPHPIQQELRFDLTGITDERFWEQAEDRILEALEDYAEHVQNGNVIRRQLFVDDAARGFAFIDLCRKRYDVVLMNPPFGATSLAAKAYTDKVYPLAKEDIDAAFVLRARDIGNDLGLAGAITNRTILFKATLEDWRRIVCFGRGQLSILADFGLGVLDNALVEAAAYTFGNTRSNSSNTMFAVRLMRSNAKGQDLKGAINNLKTSGDAEVYVSTKDALCQFPAARLAYIATRGQQAWFKKFPSFNEHDFLVRQGLITGDNFRFLRLRWEVPSKEIGARWFLFDKGGEYSPYFNEIHLFVNWNEDGGEIKNFFKPTGRIASRPQNTGFYYRPGITYPRRTGSNASFRLFPAGAIFDAQAPLITVPDDDREGTLAVSGVLNSRPIASLLELLITSADTVVSASAARTYEVGIINSLPFPTLDQRICKQLSELVLDVWNSIATRNNMFNEHEGNLACFVLTPECCRASITDIAGEALEQEETLLQRCFSATQEIGETVDELFGVDEETRNMIEAEFDIHPSYFPSRAPEKQDFSQLYILTDEQLVDTVAAKRSSSRLVTKKAFLIDRRTELLCLHFECSPNAIFSIRRELGILPTGYLKNATNTLLSYCIGLILGRWDIRIAQDKSLSLKLSNPFDPLPVYSLGMLVGPDGLPAESDRIVSEEWLRARPDAITLPAEGTVKTPTIPDSEYPLTITWSGILVDDPGFKGTQTHREDIFRRVREVLDLIWKDKTHEIEQEACDILGAKTLRDYFRKPSGFFKDHLQRYSKSRRKAPIYWPLSTASGSYTLWLYYHRLSDQILFTSVNDYLDPKLKQVSEDMQKVKQKGERSREDERELEYLSDLEFELRDLREELLRIAQFWKPNLNDGVQITAAPLWNLFRHKPWQKKLKDTWEKLEAGDYDWAHLAYSIWPERVTEKCKMDKSLAIAHDLEHLFDEE